MPEFVKLELKTLFLVLGLLGNAFLTGWVASKYDGRLTNLESNEKSAKEERVVAATERKEIDNKLGMLKVIGSQIIDIKEDIKEIKGAVK